MELIYRRQWHELLIFEYFRSKVKKVWHVAKEVTISLMTFLSAQKYLRHTCVLVIRYATQWH